MKDINYRLYNEELGYLQPEVYHTAKEASIAASNKCRKHNVCEYDGNTYIRTLTLQEEIAAIES